MECGPYVFGKNLDTFSIEQDLFLTNHCIPSSGKLAFVNSVLFVGYVVTLTIYSFFAFTLFILLLRKVKRYPDFSGKPGFIQVILQILAFICFIITYALLLHGHHAWISGIFSGLGWIISLIFISHFIYTM